MARIGDLDRLAKSFERHLRVENKADRTVETYGEAVGQLTAYVARAGVTAASQITKEHIEDFITELLATRKASTANNRFRGLQQYFPCRQVRSRMSATRARC